jgi:CRP-like cAMP-binding protein
MPTSPAVAAPCSTCRSRAKPSQEGYLVREGQEVSHCALLLSGFAFRQKLLRNGSRQIISLHIQTEFVDLQNSLLDIADHSVQSLNGSEAAIIPRDALIELQDNSPAIRMAMWVETLIDASIFREWVVNVGRRDSKSRIAHLLCEITLRLEKIGAGTNGNFAFPLTQEQLADAVGLTAVHVNRTLMRLEDEGHIRRSRRVIEIDDWQKLAKVADFEPRYLHIRNGAMISGAPARMADRPPPTRLEESSRDPSVL